MTALPQATLPLRPRRAEKVLYGRKQRQAHNDAWGEVLASSFDSVPGGMPYRFIGSLGCRTDLATGLMYMRQRWYDPTLQRFISRDPEKLAGGLNLYAYCLNNPVNLLDPWGLKPRIDIVWGPNLKGRLKPELYDLKNFEVRLHENPTPDELRKLINDCPDVLIINAHTYPKGMQFQQPGSGFCSGPHFVYIDMRTELANCKCQGKVIVLNGCQTNRMLPPLPPAPPVGPQNQGPNTIVTNDAFEDSLSPLLDFLADFLPGLDSGNSVQESVENFNRNSGYPLRFEARGPYRRF